ncbi:uncharacterized protein BDZ99DRAFT_384236 [Mytilinidion resinicola]|uniref:Enhancer of polycomb-like protein n=1 Tax=Mytilinidion resinicola TaxID=574789 RepID=A0A6A6YRT1_9PEZI|nr:uncharacterized protein BDZ99DRAFT_384236 [Mytilinidion resinicola]KAF2811481.1 hypothetical protein BDZ99DRAFT_384236 [Mytilinidion resinicola]
MTQRVTAQRFRQRKLSTKQNLAVLRENEVEQQLDDDAQRHIPKVETGVEKGEEIAVISASQAAATGGKVAQLYIPTPDAVASKLSYEDLYVLKFNQPATYIRFSSTVEDCVGCPYCMDLEDKAFLKSMNERIVGHRKGRAAQAAICSDNEFEEVMNFFEETSQTKQPYAAVDSPPVITYEEMEAEFDETISISARSFAKDIYEHWKAQRSATGNRSLMPALKFERNIETDDADPYVCFRRREVRQIRKTRGRDAQITEKLKKLRKELEDARHLMAQVRRREGMSQESLATDRDVFDQRVTLKDHKRKLGIKENDEDLINQKPAPRPKPRVDPSAMQRGIPGMIQKPQIARADGRPLDSDLVSLQEQEEKREKGIQAFIDEHKEKHRKWNENWQDETWRPITPPLETALSRSTFVPVRVEQLPTPPASVSSETSGENAIADQRPNKRRTPGVTGSGMELRSHRFSPPPEDVPWAQIPRFRARTGRGGRLMIDRRGHLERKEYDLRGGRRPWEEERRADLYKYSGDSSEDEQEMKVDHNDNLHIRYRMMLERSGEKGQASAQSRRSIDHLQHARSVSGGHLVPPSSG